MTHAFLYYETQKVACSNIKRAWRWQGVDRIEECDRDIPLEIPVLEVLRDGDKGLTVDFFPPQALTARIEEGRTIRTECSRCAKRPARQL